MVAKKKYIVPENLYYTKTHEWLKLLDESTAVIGITDYAQDMLHEIVYVDLPETGTVIEKGSPFMEIESVKSVAEIYAPVSGEIVEVNESLEDTPEILNESPYEDGWLVKIKLSDIKELEMLMDADEYLEYLSSL
jgi:glycine cleavage system H protein